MTDLQKQLKGAYCEMFAEQAAAIILEHEQIAGELEIA
tara:strand:+ start:864 stop:977 length:114 start_codon:yes stop_codon:yes gene_type:complete